MKPYHVDRIKNLLTNKGANINDTDYDAFTKAISRHNYDYDLMRICYDNQIETLFLFIYVFEYYNKSDISSSDYFVSPSCAIDFCAQMLKEDLTILGETGSRSLLKKLSDYIDDYLEGLSDSESKSYIEIYQSKGDKFSAMYCNSAFHKNMYLESMRFSDGFFMLTSLTGVRQPLTQLSTKAWTVSCESLPQVFSTDEVTFNCPPKLLTLRIKHVKKRGLHNVYVEAEYNGVFDSFYVSSVGDGYTIQTLVAYAYYIAAIRYHDEYSHVKVKSNVSLSIDQANEKTMTRDLIRIANALFPVSNMVTGKVQVTKSKITEKVRIQTKSFERFSEILCVNANGNRWQFTRHSILRYIERVLINENVYTSCAFRTIRETVAKHDWREATQAEKDLYGLQINSQSVTWISDDCPYCFVTQGQHVLTIVVKNFKEAIEAANVLRD